MQLCVKRLAWDEMPAEPGMRGCTADGSAIVSPPLAGTGNPASAFASLCCWQESGSALLDQLQPRGAPAAAAKPTVRELTPAEAAKEEGNAAFKRGEWQAAVEHYSRWVQGGGLVERDGMPCGKHPQVLCASSRCGVTALRALRLCVVACVERVWQQGTRQNLPALALPSAR